MKKSRKMAEDKAFIQKELQTKHQKLFEDFDAFSAQLTARLRQELAKNASLFAEDAPNASDAKEPQESGVTLNGASVEAANDIALATGTDA